MDNIDDTKAHQQISWDETLEELKSSAFKELADEAKSQLFSLFKKWIHGDNVAKSRFCRHILFEVKKFTMWNPSPYSEEEFPVVVPKNEFEKLNDELSDALGIISRVKTDPRCPDWAKEELFKAKALPAGAVWFSVN